VINLWHRKFVTADVTAVSVNSQHGTKQHRQDFNKTFIWNQYEERLAILNTENIKFYGWTTKLEAIKCNMFVFLPCLLNICGRFEFFISQGSVATCLRWGGYCHKGFVANFICFFISTLMEGQKFDQPVWKALPAELESWNVRSFSPLCTFQFDGLDMAMCNVWLLLNHGSSFGFYRNMTTLLLQIRLSSVCMFVRRTRGLKRSATFLLHFVPQPSFDLRVKFYGDHPRGTSLSGALNARGVAK